MTVSVPAYTEKEWAGDGVTTAFSFQTIVPETTDIKIWLRDGVNLTPQTLGIHYNLTGLGSPGGVTITFVTPPPTGTIARARRETIAKQVIDYGDLIKVPGDTTEAQLDRLAMALQDHRDILDLQLDSSDAAARAEAAAISADEDADRAEAAADSVIPGTVMDNSVTDPKLTAALANALVRTVTTRAALKALDTSRWRVVFLSEVGREGVFIWKAGNYSALVTADPLEGAYIKADAIATSAGAWVRQHNMKFDIRWFGAKLDNATDDTAAVQAAIDLAGNFTNTPYSARAEVYCPPGLIFKTTSSIYLRNPIRLRLLSLNFFYGTTGTAWIFHDIAPAIYASNWDVFFEGIAASPSAGPFPAAIAPSGPVGILIRSMTFSKFECGQLSGFSHAGMILDAKGTSYAPQIIQHVTFTLGQVVNNGAGILMHSLNAATSSCQICKFNIQNIYQNAFNIVDGDGTYKASNSHKWNINAMDNATQVGIDTYCSFNNWEVVFSGAPGTTLRLTGLDADYSSFKFTNNLSTDIVINLNGVTGKHNTIECAPPSNLPTSQVVASGIEYENVYGCSISVSVPVVGSGSYQMMLTDPAGDITTIGPSSGGGFATFPVLKHGWKWRVFTTAGSVTYGSAVITAA